MRKDTQIGVILGVVILGIIGVFLSTRTDFSKQNDEQVSYNENKTEEKEVVKTADKSKSFIDIYEDDTFIENTLENDLDKITKIEKETIVVNDIDVEDVVEVDIDSESENDEILLAETEKKFDDDIFNAIRADIRVDGKKKINVPVSVSIPVVESDNNIRILTHKVELNDNLFSLAKKYYGDAKKWTKIYDANSDVIYDKNSLPIGDDLIIPDVAIFGTKVVEESDDDLVNSHIVTVAKSTQSNSKSAKQADHVVAPGDSLYKLSRKYYGNTESWILIYNANQDKIGPGKVLYVGKHLIIPGSTKLVENKKNTSSHILRSDSSQVKTNSKVYKVKSGDSLYKIAKLHYKDGSKWRKIFDANKKVLNNNSNVVRVGVELIIP